MTRTVDLVIVGMTAAGIAAAVDAAANGRRVLIVDESRDDRYRRQLRCALGAAGEASRRRVSTLTGVEVIWVDGTTAVEVVLLRQVKTRRLIGINTGAVLTTTTRGSALAAAFCVCRDIGDQGGRLEDVPAQSERIGND
jgi:choline dehydrogenase-like flavoprotein